MFDQLGSVERRYETVEAQLAMPEISADPKKLQELMKEYAHLRDVVTAFREWKRLTSEYAEAKEMLGEDDVDMREMAREEMSALAPQIEKGEFQLKLLLLPKDPHEGRDVILEIRGGVGGDEAGLWAADLFRMYSRYGEGRGWKFDLMNLSHNAAGGYKEVIAQISGKDVDKRL